MRLKLLEIKHQNYYSEKPTTDKYTGKVEFFNEKGEGLIINLTPEQLSGIVELCAAGIVMAAKDAASSIVTSFQPALQIEAA